MLYVLCIRTSWMIIFLIIILVIFFIIVAVVLFHVFIFVFYFFKRESLFFVLIADFQSSQGRLCFSCCSVIERCFSSGSQIALPLSRLNTNTRTKEDFIVWCGSFSHFTVVQNSNDGRRNEEPGRARFRIPARRPLQWRIGQKQTNPNDKGKRSVSTNTTFNWCVLTSRCNTVFGKEKVLIRSY